MKLRQIPFALAHTLLHSLGAPPLPAVFIMGHMRCGSTLLLHILLTNPDVIGCGERNASYRSPADLDRLEIAARIAQRAPLRRVRYAVDQINHDRFTPNLQLLKDERLKCIFLVRDPKATIQSIVHLTRTFYAPWTAGQAVDYYSRRLQTLIHLASSLDGGHTTMAMTYNDLVSGTPAALRRVESFLGLDGELRERYKIQRFTGIRGDPSEIIHAGRIVRNRVPWPAEIPDRDLKRALDSYDACARAFGLEDLSRRPGPGATECEIERSGEAPYDAAQHD